MVDSGLLCSKNEPWSLPLREFLATRLRTPFPRSQALEQTTAGFPLHTETQEWGKGDFPKVTRTGVAAGHGRPAQGQGEGSLGLPTPRISQTYPALREMR